MKMTMRLTNQVPATTMTILVKSSSLKKSMILSTMLTTPSRMHMRNKSSFNILQRLQKLSKSLSCKTPCIQAKESNHSLKAGAFMLASALIRSSPIILAEWFNRSMQMIRVWLQERKKLLTKFALEEVAKTARLSDQTFSEWVVRFCFRRSWLSLVTAHIFLIKTIANHTKVNVLSR